MAVQAPLMGVLFAMGSLSGLSATRPPQINLTLELSKEEPESVDSIVNETAKELSMAVSVADTDLPNADQAKKFEIYNENVSISIIQTPDDYCIPGGSTRPLNGPPPPSTYNISRFYSVNIVSEKGPALDDLRRVEQVVEKLSKSHAASISEGAGAC